MKRNKDIQKELDTISERMSHLSFTNPYRVPEAYFDKFPEYVISAIQNNIPNQTEAAEEIQHLSPVLAGLKKSSTYFVEENYFVRRSEYFSKIYDQKKAKQIPPGRSVYLIKLAVAASFVGMIGIALLIFKWVDNNHKIVMGSDHLSSEQQIKDQLATIETEQIVAYLEQYTLPSDRNAMEQMIDPVNLPEEVQYFDEKTFDELWNNGQESKTN